MQRSAEIALIQRNRKRRQNVGAFATLITTPAASFTMPANGDLIAIGAFAGGAVFTINGATTQTVNAPALAAGEAYAFGGFEKDAKVTVAAGVKLYLDTGLGVYKQIGAG